MVGRRRARGAESFRCCVVGLLRGGWRIHRNVAEGETDFLPTGAQQNRVGGPGAIPEPLPGRLRRLRFRVVSSRCRNPPARLHNSPNGSPAPTEALKSRLSAGVQQSAEFGAFGNFKNAEMSRVFLSDAPPIPFLRFGWVSNL